MGVILKVPPLTAFKIILNNTWLYINKWENSKKYLGKIEHLEVV
jgi:hypothetical protein